MKERIKTILMFCAAFLFIGFVYPEYIFTDDVIVIVDEEGKKIGDFSSLPGSMDEKVKWLEETLESEDDDIEVDYRWLPF